MIRKIRVLDANYSGLEERFPAGLELDTDSNIVIMVGPNGSGKTALMRMLATSLTHRAFFEKHGFSERKYAYDQVAGRHAGLWTPSGKTEIDGLEATLKSANQNEDGLYEIHPGNHKTLLKLKERAGFPDIETITKHFETERYQEWSKSVGEAGFDPEEIWGFSNVFGGNLRYFSETAKTKPSREELNARSDWLYQHALEEAIGNFLKDSHGNIGITKHTTHHYVDDQTREALLQYFDKFSQQTDENVWGYVRAEIDVKPVMIYTALLLPSDPNKRMLGTDDMPYTHFREHMKKRVEESPGIALRENVDALFEEIDLHFQGKQKRYQTEEESKENYVSGRIVADLPQELRDSQLVVFSDEPTVFLDLKNKIHYRDRLLEMARKYGTDVQFFIPTNDLTLVDGCRGNCRYINLYETPTVSTSELTLEM